MKIYVAYTDGHTWGKDPYLDNAINNAHRFCPMSRGEGKVQVVVVEFPEPPKDWTVWDLMAQVTVDELGGLTIPQGAKVSDPVIKEAKAIKIKQEQIRNKISAW